MRLSKRGGHIHFLFESLNLIICVFLNRFLKVYVIDVGQSAKPGEDIREFILLVLTVLTGKGRGKLAYFLNKPHKGCAGAALSVPLSVLFIDKLLKLSDVHSAGL